MARANGGGKRGPKPWPEGPHNQKIQERIKQLEDEGHELTHGGPKTEEVIPTPGGTKTSRRPDITTRAPDGSPHREDVDRSKADGTPIKRETEALDDIEDATGTRPEYTPCDKE